MYQSRTGKSPSTTRFRVVRPIPCLMGQSFQPGDTLDVVALGVPDRTATLLWRARDLEELADEPAPPPVAKPAAAPPRVAPRGR